MTYFCTNYGKQDPAVAWISLDFTESKTRNEENKTFLTCVSYHPGAFEQLFCPGGAAFASLF